MNNLLNHLKNVIIDLKLFLEYALRFWFVTLVLILLFLIFYSMDQGKDIIASLVEGVEVKFGVRMAFSIVMLGGVGICLWFYARVRFMKSEKKEIKGVRTFVRKGLNTMMQSTDHQMTRQYIKQLNEEEMDIERVDRKQIFQFVFPRYAGMLAIMIVALAVLNVYFEIHPLDSNPFPSWLTVIFTLILIYFLPFYALVYFDHCTGTKANHPKKNANRFFIISLVIIVLLFILSLFIEHSLLVLGIIYYLLAWAVGTFLTVRTRIKSNERIGKLMSDKFHVIVFVLLGINLLFFVLLHIFPGWTQWLHPTFPIHSAIVAYSLVFCCVISS